MKSVFVTVGTTKFPLLINTITTLEVIEALKNIGCTDIQIQTGKDFEEVKLDLRIENATVKQEGSSYIVKLLEHGITIKYDQYFEDFEEQIKKADLVISHGGAGTCLNVLRLKKALIVVVNEDLMDNHQTELAYELQKNSYLYCCICRSLSETLTKNFNMLQPYPLPNDMLFSNYLDRCCGFA